jgi:RNA-binding protein
MPLTGAAARTLRALAHSLQPVVHVGKHGVTPKLVAQLERALLDHELIKVKILPEAPEDRKDIGAALADATGAELAQLIGRVALLYKPHPKKPTIKVPKGYTPKPKVKRAKDETEEE